MSILAWIVLGLIAGAIRHVSRGREESIVIVGLIGIVGAFLGGFLGNMMMNVGINGFSIWSVVLALIGAFVLLWVYRTASKQPTARYRNHGRQC